MSDDKVAGLVSSPPSPPRRSGARLRDEVILRALGKALRRLAAGRLRLTLPSGATAAIGAAGSGYDASLTLASYGILWKSLRRGAIGFADSYMAGECDTGDLHALCHFYMDNQQAIERAGRGLFRVRTPDVRFHRENANSRQGSRRNIAAHYDLGNAFYERWLDPGMTYSSGLYATAETTLAEAQAAKHRRIIDALELEAGQRLLEVGCGWGSFMEAAARRGVHATGITISPAQHREARRRLAQAGHSGLTEVRFEDYRDTRSTYQRLVSIEMIEAVGEEHWPAFFGVVANRLAAGGVAVVQAITIREDLYASYRANPDFIQRYIFPGGMLPTVSAMAQTAARAGLSFETIETFGASYARTLADWQTQFRSAWPTIQAQGFDERFRRMWEYYLAYCAVGFERGMIDVGIYRFRKGR